MTDYPSLIRRVRASWVPIRDIAAEYGLTEKYVRRLMGDGKIEVFKLDGLYHVNPASLDAHLATVHKKPTKVKTG